MLTFPTTTHFGKRIPKESFYQRIAMSSAVKRAFVDDIEQVVWLHKLSPDTLNVGKGSVVLEIEVFEVTLKRKEFDSRIFELIERAIPKHIVFVVVYGSEAMLLISYKEQNASNPTKFRIVETYQTEWMPKEEVTLQLDGLNIDQIYQSFVRQVAGVKLPNTNETDIASAVEQAQHTDKLRRQIATLEARKRNEVQFNQQIKISQQIEQLKRLLAQVGHID